MIFTSSAFIDHIILYYFLQQDFAKWLGMTCKQLHLRYRNSIWKKETEIQYNIVYAQKYLSYPIHEFYRLLYQGWAKFSLAK